MRVLTALVRGSMLAAILAAAVPSSPSPCACDRAMSARSDGARCRMHAGPLTGSTALSDPCCYGAPDFTAAPAEMTSRPEWAPGGRTFVGATATHGLGAGESRGPHASGVRESRAAGPPGFLIGEILRL